MYKAYTNYIDRKNAAYHTDIILNILSYTFNVILNPNWRERHFQIQHHVILWYCLVKFDKYMIALKYCVLHKIWVRCRITSMPHSLEWGARGYYKSNLKKSAIYMISVKIFHHIALPMQNQISSFLFQNL